MAAQKGVQEPACFSLYYTNSVPEQILLYRQSQRHSMSTSGNPSPCALSSHKKKKLDRFIPHSIERALFASDEKPGLAHSSHSSQYQELLGQRLLAPKILPKILKFSDQPEEKQNYNPNCLLHQPSSRLYEFESKAGKARSERREKLPSQPYRVLPASLLKDDFYLNLLDWSDSGQIAVALQSTLYLWSGCATRVSKVHEFRGEGDSLCGLTFLPGSTKVLLGLSRGDLALLDLQKQRFDRYQGIHLGRIGSVGSSGNLVCSGGRDGYVSVRDLRQPDEIFRYRAHEQEICGLKLSPAGDMVATGGNDNKLHLFSLKKMGSLAEWTNHKAAVKAIGFNPSDPTIVSGGGSADRRLRVFSLQTLQMLNEVDTGSQICNLAYSSISSQLVTTHGYSLNELTLWKCGSQGSLQKLDSVMGHKRRVLYLAGENNGTRVVTGAGDEELRLWKVFQGGKSVAADLR